MYFVNGIEYLTTETPNPSQRQKKVATVANLVEFCLGKVGRYIDLVALSSMMYEE